MKQRAPFLPAPKSSSYWPARAPQNHRAVALTFDDLPEALCGDNVGGRKRNSPELLRALKLLALALVLSASTTTALPRFRASDTFALHSPGQQSRIPEAGESATEEVAKWWRELTKASGELVAAVEHKDKAVREARNNIAKMNGKLLNEDDDGLSRKERDQLNAAVDTARQNYSRLLQEQKEKSYRAPVPDSRPVFLNSPFPAYSERARQHNVNGAVKMRAECRADGTIGNVTVVTGLGFGLDERATDAVRQMIFLPAIRDGAFVTFYTSMTIEFSLR